MFKLGMFLMISFFVSIANAGFKIQGSTRIASADFCNQYENLKSTEVTFKKTYELMLKIYSKQEEGSEKQKEYKIRLDDALFALNSMQENVNFYKRNEFASYKILLDSNYTVSKLDLVSDEGYLDISYMIDHGDYVSVSAGSLVVKFFGADLCGFAENTSLSEGSIARKLLSKIFY